jgi:hypothetical protein
LELEEEEEENDCRKNIHLLSRLLQKLKRRSKVRRRTPRTPH